MIKKIFSTCFILTALATGVFAQKLETGMWRGALITSTQKEIPFNFQVTGTNGKQEITILNAAERFAVTDITMQGDSIFIKMPLYGNEFRLKHTPGKLNGKWIKLTSKGYREMDFTATANTAWRIIEKPLAAKYNISGRWSAIFGETGDRDTTIGEFKQNGGHITGTFLTTTGDHRFLEGVVSGDSLYLSCFDGGNAYLFTAAIKDTATLTDGKFYSEYTGLYPWTAYKNPNAKLPDAYTLTLLKPGYTKLAFTFNDLEGKPVSLTDERFKNKVVIVQVLGSWCPNCIDETQYMVPYYNKYHPKGVEVIGLAYERTNDIEKSTRAIQLLKSRLNIPYPLLITGYTPAQSAESLPALTHVMSFPTTIIIDKKGNVRKIHTGFNGPATGEHYVAYTQEFEELTEKLLAE